MVNGYPQECPEHCASVCRHIVPCVRYGFMLYCLRFGSHGVLTTLEHESGAAWRRSPHSKAHGDSMLRTA
jgi:hypothetical protein